MLVLLDRWAVAVQVARWYASCSYCDDRVESDEHEKAAAAEDFVAQGWGWSSLELDGGHLLAWYCPLCVIELYEQEGGEV